MNFGAEACFNLNALHHNLTQVRLFAPKSKIMAMIKSNGYGHGLQEVAKKLSQESLNVDAFGVACIDEAIMLHDNAIKQPIVVMRGFSNSQELDVVDRLGFVSVIHSERQIKLLRQLDVRVPLRVWLKIDTGMHRLGFHPSEAEQRYHELVATKKVQESIGVMTHLAQADDKSSVVTANQLQIFAKFCEKLPGPKSIANSAAIINYPASCVEWVRPGLILYGAVPFAGQRGDGCNLRPVMTLKSRLIAVKKLQPGDRVGYGGTWTAPHQTVIGIASIGYGDGYPVSAPKGTPVLVAGRRCNLVGRVSMDMLTIDLGQNAKEEVGDEVVLWGEKLPVEEVARYIGTIPYVLLCGITQRVRRVYD